jgi:hypothetical protein
MPESFRIRRAHVVDAPLVGVLPGSLVFEEWQQQVFSQGRVKVEENGPCRHDDIDGIHVSIARDLFHKHENIACVERAAARLRDGDFRSTESLPRRQCYDRRIIGGNFGAVALDPRIKRLSPGERSREIS